MGQMNECFVCGRLLAVPDSKMLEVLRSDGTRLPRRACDQCYYKAVAHGSIMATENGKSYECTPRELQRDLFGRTYRKLTKNGGRDV